MRRSQPAASVRWTKGATRAGKFSHCREPGSARESDVLTLLLLRHAQAGGQGGRDDAERTLTQAGRADAVQLGRYLRDEDLIPQRALVSAAVRTRETLQGLEKGGGRAVPATYDPLLYNATSTQIRHALTEVPADLRALLVLGHNPGVAELALSMAEQGDPPELEAMGRHFPPCSLAVVTFASEAWAETRRGGGRLERFVTPDLLRARS